MSSFHLNILELLAEISVVLFQIIVEDVMIKLLNPLQLEYFE